MTEFNKVHHKYDTFCNKLDVNTLFDQLLDNLVPEVEHYVREHENLSGEEACKMVIEVACWEPFYHTLFILKVHQGPSGNYWGFKEDLQKFLEEQVPQLLFKRWYEKETATFIKALARKEQDLTNPQ